LSLWRGCALAGAHGEFVEQERTRFEQLRLATLEERIVLDLELGRHADLVAELTTLVKDQAPSSRMSSSAAGRAAACRLSAAKRACCGITRCLCR
jgi:DNA-binding SARP family transcriptional activator